MYLSVMANWEEIYRKNPRERLKKEKFPLDILKELDSLVLKGYENVPEEDIVRLQWYGLYHDKPRTGTFMLRIKLAAGRISPYQLRIIGELARKFKNYAEITVRQDIQLHYIRLEEIPWVIEKLKEANLFNLGACGDTVRNITSCPVCGIDKDELFDIEKPLQELSSFFYSYSEENRDYFDLPRKFKITISACPYHCNYPEMHDLAFIGTYKNGREGFAVWVGGGLSSTPRLARPLGIFVEPDKVLDIAREIINIWRTDLENRKSFVKARIKYFIDRIGIEEFRQRLLKKLNFKPESVNEEPKPIKRDFHEGIRPQKQKGFYYICFPIVAGRISGDQLLRIADVSQENNLLIRISQRQNIIIGNIFEDSIGEVVREMEKIGVNLNHSRSKTFSIACTSDPFCNYSVGSAKETLIEILNYLEKEVGDLEDIIIGSDGCPHACAHHWLSDIGLQATYVRKPDGSIESGLNIILGGNYGKYAGIGKIIAKRVRIEDAKVYLKNLIIAFKESGKKSFVEFIRGLDNEEILEIMKIGEK